MMFDLDTAIGGWRRRLAAQPDLQAADIDELEDHLREIVAELTTGGLSGEEAFLVAARRLGDPQALAGEFAAADPVVRRKLRFRWIIMGGLAVMALMAFADLIGALSLGRMDFLETRGNLLGWSWGGLHLLALVIGGLIIWRLLTGDGAARRIISLGFWILGLILVAMAAGLLVGRNAMLVGGHLWNPLGADAVPLHALPLMPVMMRVVLLALPPLVLIGLLWAVVRPRSGR